MIITKFKIADGYQLELPSRTYIIFTHADFGTGEEASILNGDELSAVIRDPKAIKEFKAEWSKKK